VPQTLFQFKHVINFDGLFRVSMRWVFTLTLVLALVVLSTVPGQARTGDSTFVRLVATTPTILQKLMHLLAYAGLGWLWVWTLEGVAPRWLRFVIAFILCVGLGAALEWCQTYVPGRFGTLIDVLLNTAGTIAGLLLAFPVL
jgi:hypothetical protein